MQSRRRFGTSTSGPTTHVPHPSASAAVPAALPTYLVNLPKDSDRRRHSIEQLRRCGLLGSLVFTAAVNGRELSAQSVATLYDAARNAREYPKPLGLGEIGCYASHLECWSRIAASGDAAALVIEDDVRLDDDLAQVLRELTGAGLKFDMIKLIGRAWESILRRVRSVGSRCLVDYFRVPSRTGAYLVSGEGARKLLQARRRFFRPADVDLKFWWEVDPDFQLFDMWPYPASHAGFASVLGKREPEPRGAFRYRWLRIRSQADYWTHSLARAISVPMRRAGK